MENTWVWIINVHGLRSLNASSCNIIFELQDINSKILNKLGVIVAKVPNL